MEFPMDFTCSSHRSHPAFTANHWPITVRIVKFLIWNTAETAALIVVASIPYLKPAIDHLGKKLRSKASPSQVTTQEDEPGTPGFLIEMRRRSLVTQPRSPAHAAGPSTSSSVSPLWEVPSLGLPDGNIPGLSEIVRGGVGAKATASTVEEAKEGER